MAMLPSVTMKGASRALPTSVPLTSPTSVPVARAATIPAGMASSADSPESTTTVPSTTPEMAMMAPTERSMPPVRMTMSWPAAMMPMTVDWSIRFLMLPAVRK